MLPATVHSVAVVAFERLLYSLAAGTTLVFLISIFMRLIPTRNSHTRFAVWFSALMAVIALPFFAAAPAHWMATAAWGPAHSLITIPPSWAEYIVLAWVFLASLGLARMAFGLWQLRRLRRNCSQVDMERLGPLAKKVMLSLQGTRRVSLLSSTRIEVPTAMGFLHPAIVLPAWMVADAAKADSAVCDDNLRYILLHELAHLTRWDDWTNLAQKLIKAILFFHPGVWWIERNLALDREMACDDAVISQTGNAREYAKCLTRIAEKSFLRRQIALAQAAVSRMKHLSLRVAGIMKTPGPRSTRIWKPAVPIVMAVAVLCAISASNTTRLVAVGDGHPAHVSSHDQLAVSQPNGSADQVVNSTLLPHADAMAMIRPSAVSWNYGRASGSLRARRHIPRTIELRNISQPSRIPRGLVTRISALERSEKPVPLQDLESAQVVVLVVSSRSVIKDGSSNWHVNSVELFFYVPASTTKQNPRKT